MVCIGKVNFVAQIIAHALIGACAAECGDEICAAKFAGLNDATSFVQKLQVLTRGDSTALIAADPGDSWSSSDSISKSESLVKEEDKLIGDWVIDTRKLHLDGQTVSYHINRKKDGQTLKFSQKVPGIGTLDGQLVTLGANKWETKVHVLRTRWHDGDKEIPWKDVPEEQRRFATYLLKWKSHPDEDPDGEPEIHSEITSCADKGLFVDSCEEAQKLEKLGELLGGQIVARKKCIGSGCH